MRSVRNMRDVKKGLFSRRTTPWHLLERRQVFSSREWQMPAKIILFLTAKIVRKTKSAVCLFFGRCCPKIRRKNIQFIPAQHPKADFINKGTHGLKLLFRTTVNILHYSVPNFDNLPIKSWNHVARGGKGGGRQFVSISSYKKKTLKNTLPPDTTYRYPLKLANCTSLISKITLVFFPVFFYLLESVYNAVTE